MGLRLWSIDPPSQVNVNVNKEIFGLATFYADKLQEEFPKYRYLLADSWPPIVDKEPEQIILRVYRKSHVSALLFIAVFLPEHLRMIVVCRDGGNFPAVVPEDTIRYSDPGFTEEVLSNKMREIDERFI